MVTRSIDAFVLFNRSAISKTVTGCELRSRTVRIDFLSFASFFPPARGLSRIGSVIDIIIRPSYLQVTCIYHSNSHAVKSPTELIILSADILDATLMFMDTRTRLDTLRYN